MNFDIERYKQRARRLDEHDIDYDSFSQDPLPEPALRCVRYMHDVESHTACYLRDLLVTRAHRDPDLTAFLTCWAFEELWHGEALGRVLAAHGEPSGSSRIRPTRARLPWRDQVSPMVMALTSAATPHLEAVHMTWGAVNEWTTQAGYAQLARRTNHPTLGELLRRIMRQEGRHIDFYASRAGEALERSRAARRITRFALRRLWAPVGSSVMPATEVAHLVSWLFGGATGLDTARRIDRRINRLPGLGGLGLIEGARASHVTETATPAPTRRPRFSIAAA